MFLFKRFFLPCGRQNDMLVISNASERSHTKRSLIRRVFGAPRPRMTAFTKASSQVPFRTHVRNLNLSFFSVRFFISLRSVPFRMTCLSFPYVRDLIENVLSGVRCFTSLVLVRNDDEV